MSKQKRSVYLPDETLEIIDDVKENSMKDPNMMDLSGSEAICELVHRGIESVEDDPLYRELIDPIDLEMWKNQQRHEARRKKAKFADMAGGWRGRVRKYLNQRLAGPEPHPPEKIEQLKESYMGDIVDWEKDSETFETDWQKVDDHRDWLDEMVSEYRDAYQAKMILPDEAFENHDDVQTGADLKRLGDRFDEVLLSVSELASGEACDPDAIYRRLGGEYAVDPGTVELVVDKLTGDDVDTRMALKSGKGILEAVDAQALEAWGGDSESLTLEGETQSVDTVKREPETEPVDPSRKLETVDEIPDDAIVRKGGRADHSEPVEEPRESAEPEVPDGGLTVEDLTTESLIQAALEMIENGKNDSEIFLSIRPDAPTDTSANCAIEAARERVKPASKHDPGSPATTLTDGGETYE